jgi:hypothetical protein
VLQKKASLCQTHLQLLVQVQRRLLAKELAQVLEWGLDKDHLLTRLLVVAKALDAKQKKKSYW